MFVGQPLSSRPSALPPRCLRSASFLQPRPFPLRWTCLYTLHDTRNVMRGVSRLVAPVALVVAVVAAIVSLALPPAAAAQPVQSSVGQPQPPHAPSVPTASGGIIRGIISTQNGAIPLGGVLVSLLDERTTQVATVLSEGDGSFRFEGLESSVYRVAASLDGFDPKTVAVTVEYNQTADVPLDLPIAGVNETVTVVAPDTVVPSTGTITPGQVIESRELEQLAPGGGMQAALRLIASVIEVPGGVAIKGGRPSQASVQLGPASFVDPSTGLSQVRLPDDAIESVTVLANPYAVEYGRFSSGLVLIQTRRATDRWRTRVNNLDPTFRTRRGSALRVTGIAGILAAPRDRRSDHQGSAGSSSRRRSTAIGRVTFRAVRWTSCGARTASARSRGRTPSLTDRHSLVALAGFFPTFTKYANLGTFTPPAGDRGHARWRQYGGGHRAIAVERCGVHRDDRRSESLPDRRAAAGRRGDGTAAGRRPAAIPTTGRSGRRRPSRSSNRCRVRRGRATCCTSSRAASTCCTAGSRAAAPADRC